MNESVLARFLPLRQYSRLVEKYSPLIMNLTCAMRGSNGHSLTDYHNSDANSTPDTERGRQWAGERETQTQRENEEKIYERETHTHTM